MNTSGSHRKVIVAGILLAASALLLVSWSPTARVSARSGKFLKRSNSIDVQRAARQAELQARLESTDLSEFQSSLGALSGMDEPGVLGVWQTALRNPDVRLRLEAWRKYGEVQAEISRKQYVPQIARIDAPSELVTALAKDGGYDITIWTSSDNQSVVAAPPYLIERIRNEGITSKILYNSVSDWQKARSTGDIIAQAITPKYQTDSGAASQIRIAVINLADRTSATPGYS